MVYKSFFFYHVVFFQTGPTNGPSNTVKSNVKTNFRNQVKQWHVNCCDKMMYAKSELAYDLSYNCFGPCRETSSPTSVLSKPQIQNRSEYKFSKLSMQFFQLETEIHISLPLVPKNNQFIWKCCAFIIVYFMTELFDQYIVTL